VVLGLVAAKLFLNGSQLAGMVPDACRDDEGYQEPD
jgi:hypothetical protein